MSDKDIRIDEQHSLYRRGIVLGLTMAEIMILILFTLLLALAAAIAVKEEAISEKEKEISESREKISKLEDLRAEFISALTSNSGGVRVEDIIVRIERLISKNSQLEEALEEARGEDARKREDMEKIAREIERQSGKKPNEVDEIIEHLAERNSEASETGRSLAQSEEDAARLQERLERSQGRIAGLEKQLEQSRSEIDRLRDAMKEPDAGRETAENAESGKGKDLPSCWLTEADRIESIFAVMFSLDGVRLTHRDLPHRNEDLKALPLEPLAMDVNLTLAEFRDKLKPLFLWSVERECRFYVVRFSQTQAMNGALVNAVDAYFYPDSSIQIVGSP